MTMYATRIAKLMSFAPLVFRYYYIDFNHFTNVVRYRVHLMQKELERLEREANENQMYLCPQCNKRLPMLQVQSLRNKNFGFCCPACCPEVRQGASLSV